MIKNGRQAAPTLEGIRDDHLKRYEFAINLAKKTGVKNIADIGKGTGYGAYLMASSGFNVVAYEIDPEAVEYGEKHYSHPNLRRIVADLKNLGSLDALGLDMVTAFEIVEHTPAAPGFLEKVEAAQLVCSVPNQDVVPFGPKVHSQHYRHYTPGELKEELQQCGWRVSFLGSQIGKHNAKAKVKPETNGRTLLAHAYRSI